MDAMDLVLRQHLPPPDFVFHSDRGGQNTGQGFRDRLRLAGIRQGMSRSDCCYDNAVAENFFRSLKVEWLHGHEIGNCDHIRNEGLSYIKGYYNRSRRNSTLGYCSPEAFERHSAEAAA